MARKITVITPTHNRKSSLLRLLEALARQRYPMEDLEVVIVCDACTDNTVEMLRRMEMPFALKYIEQSGLGAGNARNAGAAVAAGEQLVFLDDDIEPSQGLLQAYERAVEGPEHVVVGYLPMELKGGVDFHQIVLTRWWEKKYRLMDEPGYRHNYEDLLSGNFSLMATKFREVGGFNARFRCREDYELGYRLIRAGARFRFCRDAWGIHRDEITDKSRLNARKVQEGYWDVEFARLHPELTPGLRLGKMRHPNWILRTELFLAFRLPVFSDLFAEFSRMMMRVYQKLRLRRLYRIYDDRLHSYWYIRGVRDNVKSLESLRELLELVPRIPKDVEDDIDIGLGLEAADAELKQMNVTSVNVFLNGVRVASLRSWPGVEPLRVEHLRQHLANRYLKEMHEALVIEQACKQ